LDRSQFDEERDTSISSGPGFVLGAFDSVEQAQGYRLVEQDECELLLTLPTDTNEFEHILIDYHSSEFVFA
jgi:hypothetical protein